MTSLKRTYLFYDALAGGELKQYEDVRVQLLIHDLQTIIDKLGAEEVASEDHIQHTFCNELIEYLWHYNWDSKHDNIVQAIQACLSVCASSLPWLPKKLFLMLYYKTNCNVVNPQFVSIFKYVFGYCFYDMFSRGLYTQISFMVSVIYMEIKHLYEFATIPNFFIYAAAEACIKYIRECENSGISWRESAYDNFKEMRPYIHFRSVDEALDAIYSVYCINRIDNELRN